MFIYGPVLPVDHAQRSDHAGRYLHPQHRARVETTNPSFGRIGCPIKAHRLASGVSPTMAQMRR